MKEMSYWGCGSIFGVMEKPGNKETPRNLKR